MEILIFRTNIKSKKKLKVVKPVLNDLTSIYRWTIDLDDIDNVLRIEAEDNLSTNSVIQLIKNNGFYAEELMY